MLRVTTVAELASDCVEPLAAEADDGKKPARVEAAAFLEVRYGSGCRSFNIAGGPLCGGGRGGNADFSYLAFRWGFLPLEDMFGNV